MGILFTFLGLILVFLIRINFWEIYQKFGFYQGDIWYFYTYYGDQIRNNFFYQIEYPTGYVIIQKLTLWISQTIFGTDTYTSFMMASALLIIPTCLALVLTVDKMSKLLKIDSKRIKLYLILSPSLFLYSTINYDIFPSLITVLSTYLLLIKKASWAFLLIGIGTSIKLYPVFLVPLFMMFLIYKGHKKIDLIRDILIFCLTYVSLNLPFFVYNKSFWIYPYTYQLSNPERNDPSTISYFLFNITGLAQYQGYLVSLLILLSWFISYIFLKKRLLTEKNLCLLVLLICFSAVFGNHVYTPQYILWFLPFLPLTQVIPLKVWWPFDLVNASSRFFYFKIKDGLLNFIWPATVIYYLILYILLITNVYKTLSKTEQN
jgi:hypothetical protein